MSGHFVFQKVEGNLQRVQAVRENELMAYGSIINIRAMPYAANIQEWRPTLTRLIKIKWFL
jgi:hypothetical protein